MPGDDCGRTHVCSNDISRMFCFVVQVSCADIVRPCLNRVQGCLVAFESD